MTDEEHKRYMKLKRAAAKSFAAQNRYAEEAGFVLVDDAGYGRPAPTARKTRRCSGCS